MGRDAPLEKEKLDSSVFVWKISIDTGAWWATVHGVAKSWDRTELFRREYLVRKREYSVETSRIILKHCRRIELL